ncbi:MAG: SdrD B-like domain-containing protein [Planctomycetia bacterium]|nr:SdrD B-like domain-containing protein [Planctomycetia bacterium]
MSLLMKKHAIESDLTKKSKRGRRKSAKKSAHDASRRRVFRFEELEKREYLAADPISVGVVYAEQNTENLGDKFFVAWVGGEDGSTTLDSLVINLDKNGNGQLDDGEPFFDTQQGGLGVYSSVPFTLVDKTDHIGYSYEVEDGGMTLSISFTNFYAGDHFVFVIDLDEYQTNSSIDSNNAQVEAGEMGGSVVQGINGATATALFSSDHYQPEIWTGMFVDMYDEEYTRSEALSDGYDRTLLPYDLDDGNEGLDQAGIYDKFDLTPKPIIVSGYVYADYDVDCNFDDTDDPIAGVGVTLVSENGDKWYTTTDANGYYEFNSDDLMPGEYQIFSESDLISPEGWQYFDFCAKGGEYGEKITPIEIDVKGMQGGDVAPDNNFAKVLVSSIEGYVFEDLNDANGKESGESWDGVTYPARIELYRIDYDASGVATYTFMEAQTVDAEGHYKFELDGSWNEAHSLRKLPEKTYEIREVFASSDYSDGKDYIGTLGGTVDNDVLTDIFVGYGQHGYHYDFGELKLGSIAGNVYEDRNDNGIIDNGEAGIAGVTIELYQWDGASYVKIAETQTDEDGSYLFDNLDINKEYAVKELQPSAYDDGKDTIGSLGGQKTNDYFSDIAVGWDQHGVEYNFGELKLGSIAGNVYEDRNDNGFFDDAEPGIGSVVVELYQWDGSDYVKIAETQTAEDGSYLFDKLDINKEYAVREKQPEEYTDGKDSVGSLGGQLSESDYIDKIDVQWDDHGVDYNFGELKLGSISGYVYHDRNDNGLKEDGEEGIANVTVELYRLDGEDYVKIAETTTNSEGFYKFDSLDIEQTYAVREIQPSDWDDGKDTIGSLGGNVADNDYMDKVRILWDQHGQEYNFGELTPLGSLSGYVYEDNNNNGVKNDGEAGIKDVLVSLYVLDENNHAVLQATQLTDSDGFYLFNNLEPDKTYIVRETQPSAYYDGKDAVGTIFGETVGSLGDNDELVDILLPRRGQGVHYDFGELKPGSLSGYVYEDNNDNGIMDEGEAPIANVPVTLYILNEETGLYEATGRVVQTDADGYYLFDNLEPARVYRIVETQPKGYIDGKDTIGSLGGQVSNDVFYSIPVMPNDHGVEYNFGELPTEPDKPYIPEGTPPSPTPVPNNLWAPSPTAFPYIWYQPSIPGSMTTLYGGGGGFTESYSWHLSVLDATSPRSLEALTTTYGFRNGLNSLNDQSVLMNVSSVSLSKLESGQWFLCDTNGNVVNRYSFGLSDATPVVGDWNGDGVDKIGVFIAGTWYLDRDGNGEWDEMDVLAELGTGSDQPVTGDWDGDGKYDIGIFGPKWTDDSLAISLEPGLPSDANISTPAGRAKNIQTEASFHQAELNIRRARRLDSGQTRYDLIDHVFEYGSKDDYALIGDWNGDGVSKIGVYRGGDWYLDMNGNGRWDDGDVLIRNVGGAGYTPVVGDWNGDGIDTIGIFKDGKWMLDVDGDHRLDKTVSFQEFQAGDRPVTGDWNGDGVDELGIYRPSVAKPEGSDMANANAENGSEIAQL